METSVPRHYNSHVRQAVRASVSMISLDVALYQQSDLDFAVVRVPDPVLEDQGMIDTIVAGAVLQFRRPVVLMGAERHETYGRADIRGFLNFVNPAQLTWTPTALDI